MTTTINTLNAYDLVLQALCVWREARGESKAAQAGVLWTILNRASRPAWWNGYKAFDTSAVILFPEQFSSFNVGDSNATKFPATPQDKAIFQNIMLLVLTPGDDPTGRATHYFSGGTVPSWASEMVFTVQIDAFKFYRVEE